MNKNAKLRRGRREEGYGDTYVGWFVLDAEPWTLDAIREDAQMYSSEYEYPEDIVESTLDEMVADQFGTPYGTIGSYDTGMPEVSPSGRWFGYVYARQVGRRLLVKQYHALDV